MRTAPTTWARRSGRPFLRLPQLLFVAVVLTSCSSGNSPLISTQEDADARLAELGYEEPRIQWENPAEIDIPTTPLTILYGDSIFYRSSDENFRSRRGYMIRPLQGGAFLVGNRWFRLQNSDVALTYVSRDPAIALVTEDGELLFGSEGQTSVVVGFRDFYVDIPIRVVKVDLFRSLSTNQVAAQWGPAEDVNGVVLNWGQFAFLNEKEYQNRVAGTILQIEQWFYGRLPGGYLEFRANLGRELQLWQIRTQGWENTLFSPIYPAFYFSE
jgi:hypothetical protein